MIGMIEGERGWWLVDEQGRKLHDFENGLPYEWAERIVHAVNATPPPRPVNDLTDIDLDRVVDVED